MLISKFQELPSLSHEERLIEYQRGDSFEKQLLHQSDEKLAFDANGKEVFDHPESL